MWARLSGVHACVLCEHAVYVREGQLLRMMKDGGTKVVIMSGVHLFTASYVTVCAQHSTCRL